jgi:hypothetical protein
MKLDILRDENMKLIIRDGDFVIGDATSQHANIIVNSAKGELRLFPTVGVSIISFIGTKQLYELEQFIKSELSREGIALKSIDTELFRNEAKIKMEVL